MKECALPKDIAAAVGGELECDERIVWVGQPVAARLARKSFGQSIVGIIFVSAALFSIFQTKRQATSDSFTNSSFPAFMALLFVAVGLKAVSSPYRAYRKAKRTAYVITDRRAFVLAPGSRGKKSLRSFEPNQLGDILRTENRDGSGDLVFERIWSADGEGGRYSTNYGFLSLPDVKSVEALIRELSRKGKNPKA